ncbi:MAG: sulfotransferase family protein [Parvularculaceae bacterium]
MSAGPIFIGGAPRSGLTLLRVILDAHPAISCGPDVGHVALTMTSADFAATLGGLHADHFHLTPKAVREAFACAIAAPMEKRCVARGKQRWADKTAFNILVFEQLARLFPDARFIHVVRDGRDVAASLLERQWRSPSGAVFQQCASAAGAARYWRSLVARGLTAESDTLLDGRILRLRYEDLVKEPQQSMRDVCEFLGEDFDPAMVRIEATTIDLAGLELEAAGRLRRPVNQTAAGRWRRDLAPADAAAIRRDHAPIFDALEYPAT